MPIERIYADHSNKLKSLANTARKATLSTRPIPTSPSAKKAYANEVESLNRKLDIALRNSPRERQAQIVGNAIVEAKKAADPGMTPEDLKKIKAQALAEARVRTQAKKELIDITPEEWAAIQAGAVSANKLNDILNNSDIDKVKQLAMPKTKLLMTTSKLRRAQAMASSGYTQAEIASALGVSLTTLKKSLSEGG